jgi:hypothetical protein
LIKEKHVIVISKNYSEKVYCEEDKPRVFDSKQEAQRFLMCIAGCYALQGYYLEVRKEN